MYGLFLFCKMCILLFDYIMYCEKNIKKQLTNNKKVL